MTGETALQLKCAIVDLVARAFSEIKAKEARAVLAEAHFRKALRSDIRQKLVWSLPDDASLDDLLKKTASQLERKEQGVNAICTRAIAHEATGHNTLSFLPRSVIYFRFYCWGHRDSNCPGSFSGSSGN